MKLDKRKNYYLVLDTETANGYLDANGKLILDDSLVYDIGGIVIDKKGKIYSKFSFAIKEIFEGEKDMMQSAYYANKLPSYYDDIEKGERKLVSIWDARRYVNKLIEYFDITAVSCHNARFDDRALKNTVRWLSGSKCRYFFKYGVVLFDTMFMAQDTIAQEKGYKRFCEKYGFMTNHKKPRVRVTAEALYAYITGNPNFAEVHKGIDDCLVEGVILVTCLKKHKKMRKKLWEN